MLRQLFSSLLLLSVFHFSQTIEEIRFSGNKNFSTQQLKQFVNVFPPIKFTENIIDSISSNLQLNLHSNGYFNSILSARLEKIDSLKSALIFEFHEGEPSTVENIFISNSDSSIMISTFIESKFALLKKEIFNSFELEKAISEALAYADNNGYPFTKIEVGSIQFYNENKSIDIFLSVTLSDKKLIDDIVIKGNDKTESYVILRELPLKVGDVFSGEAIKKIPPKLNRLRFFEPVMEPNYLIDSKRKGILEIVVKEKSTSNFDGIIGYIPPAKNESSGYLTGLVNINLRNIFGTGRAALVKWQRIDRASQELELKYFEPWFFSFPFDVSLGMNQRKQDSTYIKSMYEGSVDYRASDEISFGVYLTYDKIIPQERTNKIFTVYNSTVLTSGLQFKYDSRDDPVVPLSGFVFFNSYGLRKKEILGPVEYFTSTLEKKITFNRIIIASNFYYKLFSTQVIALSANAKLLTGSFFELSDLFFLGGTNSLRGYRENQFQGSSIGWTNLEYRFLLAQRSFAFLFFDTGYYYRPEDKERNILRSEGFKHSFGGGLTFETGIGLMNISYALGEGDSFSEGKIHFGVINEF